MKKMICSLFVLFSSVLIAETNYSLKPGTKFIVEMPELGRMLHNDEPVKFEVYLPESYDKDKSFPLICWLGGGKGGHYVGQPLSIFGPMDYIYVAFPYLTGSLTPPEIISDGVDNSGNIDFSKLKGREAYLEQKREDSLYTRHAFYEQLLNHLHTIVTNIDRKRIALGGWSSGGINTYYQLQINDGHVTDMFCAFFIGGAIGFPSKLEHLKDVPVFMCIGENDPRKTNFQMLKLVFEHYGSNLHYIEFPNTGHEIPSDQFMLFRKFAKNYIKYPGLEQSINEMDDAIKSKNYKQAILSMHRILSIADPVIDEYSKAIDVKKKLEQVCKSEAVKLLENKNSSAKQYLLFLDLWDGIDGSQPVLEAANSMGQKALEKIISSENVSLSDLKKFIETWDGLACCHSAIEQLDVLAQNEYEKIKSIKGETQYANALSAFIETYSPAATAITASDEYEKLAEEALQKALEQLSSMRKKSDLKKLIRTYKNSKSAEKAQKIIDNNY